MGIQKENFIRKLMKLILRRLGLFELALQFYSGGQGVSAIRNILHSIWLRFRERINGQPVPQSGLLFLVAGTTDVHWFIHSGKLAFESIHGVLRRNRIAVDDLSSILDFGCGCGRVIRHWRNVKNLKLFGTDYNSRLIAWCKSNLPFADFVVNNLNPPLKYNNDEFDFVYALSIFTHLPEHLQYLWMYELRRVIRPGGYLFITTHGRYYLSKLNPINQEIFRNDQLVVLHSESEGTNQCASFHPEKYVRDKLADGFEVLDFVPEGAKGNPWQDVSCFKRSSPKKGWPE